MPFGVLKSAENSARGKFAKNGRFPNWCQNSVYPKSKHHIDENAVLRIPA